MDAAGSLLAKTDGRRFGAILADPPWQFQNKTGKVAPEHRHCLAGRGYVLPSIMPSHRISIVISPRICSAKGHNRNELATATPRCRQTYRLPYLFFSLAK